jgi:hypothetical protein
MILPTRLLLAAVVELATPGYEVDADSWQGDTKVWLMTTATAADGYTFTGRDIISREAERFDLRFIFTDFFEEGGFVVRRGPGEKIWVYGPGGRAMKSVVYESLQWVPSYRMIFGMFPKPPKKATKK